jgi:small subunit ribosomal protein S17
MAAPQPTPPPLEPRTPRKTRKCVVGVVTSDKMTKTITVAVERRVLHPRVKKYIRHATRYKAHDERQEARVGDTVRIMETRPLSKTKRWRLVEIVARSRGVVEPGDLGLGEEGAAPP